MLTRDCVLVVRCPDGLMVLRYASVPTERSERIYFKEMNHKRIVEMSTEMIRLLDKQRKLMTDTSGSYTKEMTADEIQSYGERNERLRELSKELNTLV